MAAKYTLTPIPPLPEKQVSGAYLFHSCSAHVRVRVCAGKFEEDLIEHRKQILQLWVAKICRHPLLSNSEAWMHFITCTDEKKWKEGV
jgi:sorting nexin-9/18/33